MVQRGRASAAGVLRQSNALSGVPYSCEVVVVNDGSEDDTAAVLERLRREHPFLHVVTHRSRQGIADALRSAGEVARGDIFVFYPADLQFLPSEVYGPITEFSIRASLGMKTGGTTATPGR